EAAVLLLSGVERCSDVFSRCNLAIELASVAKRLAPEARIGLCKRAAEVLIPALRRGRDGRKSRKPALGVAFVMARLDPGTADVLVSPVLGRIRDTWSISLAEDLLAVAGRIPPTEASGLLVSHHHEMMDTGLQVSSALLAVHLPPTLNRPGIPL